MFLALQAANRGYSDEVSRTLPRQMMDPGYENPRVHATTPWQADLELIRRSLAFSENTDVPRSLLKAMASKETNIADVLSNQERIMTLSEIRQRIVQLADQMDEQFVRLEGMAGT
jgi:hypothetical protein